MKNKIKKSNKKLSGRINKILKCFVIAAGFSLTMTQTFAYDLEPTLDKIKTNSVNFIENYNNGAINLSTTQNDGDLSINYNGTKYYFTPSNTLSETELTDLKNLVNTGNSSLIETTSDDAMYSFIDPNDSANNKYFKYDTTKLPTSAISYAAGTENDYTFKVETYNKENNTTEVKYFKVNISNDIENKITNAENKKPNANTPSNITSNLIQKLNNKPHNKTSNNESRITFSEGSSTDVNKVAIKLPNGTDTPETKYIKYSYDNSNYDNVYTTRQNNTITSGTDKKLFKEIQYQGSTRYLNGGGVYNNSNIDNLNADFIGNKLSNTYTTNSSSSKGETMGGGLYNNTDKTISNLTGDFIDNSVTTTGKFSYAYGGAIGNKGTITNIIADFIGNNVNASGSSSNAYGGAIYNYNGSTIGDITGDIIGNSATGYYGTYGGAIANNAAIGDITGDIIGNSAISENYGAYGGAIYNYNGSTIGDITGDIIGNSATGSSASGGAIYNYQNATISDITGDIIGNSAISENYGAYGGAIYNYNGATIGNITGDIIGNSATGSSAYGGAILNGGTIGNITGDIIGNSATSTNDYASGGAIYNYQNSSIGNITGDIIGNSATSTSTNYSASGGAIYNVGTIGNITGDIIGNSATSNNYAHGGAIYNNGTNATIGNITGDIIGNSATGNNQANGGAISNSATIGNITGNIIGNSATSNSGASGGALYNNGTNATIGNITGNIIGNSATGNFANGGAIYNEYGATIGNITGDIIGNSATSENNYAYGGAIYNNYYATIGDITGDIIGNSATGTNGIVEGGVICNRGTIGDITGDIIGNSATGNNIAYGGAIYNYQNSSIGNITGDIIGNSATSTNSYASGGAIANFATIGDITGDIIGNSVIGNNSASGGAIYNSGATALDKFLLQVNASSFDEFLSNNGFTLEQFLSMVQASSIDEFLSNQGLTDSDAIISNLSGDLIGNSAKSKSGAAQGGAIYTSSDLTISTTDSKPEITIKDNYTAAGENYETKDDNAIYVGSNTAKITFKANSGTINLHDNIRGELGYDVEFKGSDSTTSSTPTGTINWYNSIYDGDLTVDNLENLSLVNDKVFDYNVNTLTSDENTNYYLDVNIDSDDLTLSTADNITTASNSSGTVKLKGLNIVDIDSLNNLSKDDEIKIQILKTQSDDIQLSNGLTSEDNEYILSESSTTSISTPNVSWEDNVEATKTTTKVKGQFDIGTTTTTNDSIIFSVNEVTQNETITQDGDTIALINQDNSNPTKSATTDNSEATYTASSDFGTTKGDVTIKGATSSTTSTDENGNQITTVNTSTIDLGNTHTGFKLNDNNTTTNPTTNPTNNTTLTLDTVKIINPKDEAGSVIDNEYGVINLKDVLVEGEDINSILNNGDMNLSGNNTLNTNVLNSGTINLNDGELSLGSNGILISNDNSNFIVNGGSLNLQNNAISNTNLGNLTLNNNLNLKLDVNLAKETIDTIDANNVTINNNSKINVSSIKILEPTSKSKLSLLFTNNKDIANATNYTGEKTITYSPIYKYETSYKVDDDKGYFKFQTPSSGNGNSSSNDKHPAYSDLNPAVMNSTVTRNSAAYTTQANALYEGFRSLNEVMYMTRIQRMALKNRNKYAIADTNTYTNSPINKTDVIDSLQRAGIQADDNEKTGWFKANTTFEKVDLKHGPDVDNILYSAFLGYDSELNGIDKFKILKGWDFMYGGYVGYTGGYQKFDGISSTSNGANLGLTLNLFKDNFFTGTTLGSGWILSNGSTMYGHENFNTITAGIANKTGYNFEFKDGKYILQPSLFMSYSALNTLDYTNAADVRIKSDVLHLLTIEPSLKFITNLNNGWQPYIGVSFVGNIDMGGKVKANDVVLPDVSAKPYIKYGIGTRKTWKDKFSGFLQAYVTNGGRTGVGLQAGFDWLFDTRKKKAKNESL